MELLETAKNFGIFLAELIIALFFCKQYLQKYFKKTDVAKALPKQNKLDVGIVEQMESVKEILNADRVHIYEFHNGEHGSSNRPLYRFSCTYEVCKAGNKPVQQQCINLPTNCMPKFIQEIMDNGKFVCTDIEKIKDTMPSTYNFKKNIKIDAFYDVAINNNYGEIIGFIAIHWFNKNNFRTDSQVIDKLVWYASEHLKKSK